jgi:TolB-like protein
MDDFGNIGRWIANNESLLSGMAALVALTGLVLSPIGKGLRRFYLRRTRSAAGPGDGTLAPTPTGTPAEPLLAVLAFDNLSSDPEMQYFSDGVSEEIIRQLSRGARLKVIGRTSSFQFRGGDKAAAARALAYSHILDGAIRRAQGRVRINAHLVESATQTTMWSDRYDRDLEDIFAVQDEIAANIARALDHTISGPATMLVESDVYDLYLRTSPSNYAPAELRQHVGSLEIVTRRAPEFVEAWARLAYLRAWLHSYEPFANRPQIEARVLSEADRALAADPQNVDALAAKLFVIPPFGRFGEAHELLQQIRCAPGSGDAHRYVGWYLRTFGNVREALDETERAYRLDALNPMTANLVALARMAAGKTAEAIPVFQDLVARLPDMSFPVSSLLRAYAFEENWEAVDQLLTLAAKRELREFEEGLIFIRAKREPTRANLDTWRRTLEAQVSNRGCVDVARLTYSAHFGLVDEAPAFRAVERAPRPGRVLARNWQVAGLCRRGPLRLQVRVRKSAAYSQRRLHTSSVTVTLIPWNQGNCHRITVPGLRRGTQYAGYRID